MAKATVLERMMLDMINEERSRLGLDALVLETRLNDAADDHTAWMIERDVFSHTGVDGTDAGERMRDAGFAFEGRWSWGENVALQSVRGEPGLADDVADLHEALMNSPGHRKNVLSSSFEAVGIGIERGAYKGYDSLVVTQNFASTDAALRVDLAPDLSGDGPGVGNGAPVVTATDLLAEAGAYRRLANNVDVVDPDGDPIRRIEIAVSDPDARIRVAKRDVDATDGFVFTASDLATLTARAPEAGRAIEIDLRAHDGEGWGDWDRMVIRARGEVEAKPEPLSVAVEDVFVLPGDRVALSEILQTSGGSNPVRSFRVQDEDGGASLWTRHAGEIDASSGRWFGMAAADRVFVAAADEPGIETFRVKVFDGKTRTGWESFEVHTLDPDPFDAPGWDLA